MVAREGDKGEAEGEGEGGGEGANKAPTAKASGDNTPLGGSALFVPQMSRVVWGIGVAHVCDL